ncbi:MAG: hypothetical protein PHI19_07315, partial [Clostridia bacterium]|nr:hypothetical protein [Clostridia bacterium]
ISAQQKEAMDLSAILLLQGYETTIWSLDGDGATDPIAALQEANVIISLLHGQSEPISKPEGANYPFEPSKAAVINHTLGCVSAAKQLDTFAEAYKISGSNALILHIGMPQDFAVAYLYKKYTIESFGLFTKAENTVKSLISQTAIKAIDERSIATYRAAGVGNLLWVYEIKDQSGRDLTPLFRVAAAEEPLAVSRFELSLSPLKSLRFFGYYHSAAAIAAPSGDYICKLLQAIAQDEPAELTLTAINKEYIDGIDEVPVILPCTVNANGITPQEASLPLQCVLASNDYAGALLTAVNALAKRSKTLFTRALKLDPYIASVLTLDEADTLAEHALRTNPTASAFFGGK